MGIGLVSVRSNVVVGDPSDYRQPWWWISAGISVFLVLFAGIMSGLTLGLMSLGLVDLDVLQQSGSEEEKKQASMCFLIFLILLICLSVSPSLLALDLVICRLTLNAFM